MKITQVKKIKDDLYEIIVNEDEIFKVSEDFIIKYHLYHNKEISEDEYGLLKTLTNYSKIYNKTLNFISYKMRTEDEVIQYLLNEHCKEPYLSEIIDKLKKLNYINDAMYADMYVKHQFEMNKKGPHYIKNELLKKKVKENLIAKSLEFITSDKIAQNVFYLIEYYDKLNKNKSINKLKESVLRNILSKGYAYEDIADVINQYSFKDNNHDKALLEKELRKAYIKYEKKYDGYELKNRVIRSLLNKGFLYEDINNMLVSMNTEG